MEGRLLLKNCSFFGADGRLRDGMAVQVEGRRVEKVAFDGELPMLPGDWEVACRGRLVAPGLVDAHAHLVGAGLPPAGEGSLTSEQGVSPGEVEALTALGLARALRAGVTTVFEQLRASADVAGSLGAQARVAARLGARLVGSHCAFAAAQLEANAEHARAYRNHPLVRSALGFSVSSDDELLRRVGRMRGELGVGAHFHLPPGQAQRLARLGLLGRGSIAAAVGPLEEADLEPLASTQTLLAWSPRRALASGAGPETLGALLSSKAAVGLGSGGGSMADELCAATLALGRLEPQEHLRRWLRESPAKLLQGVFGLASGIEEGSLADLVVFDEVGSNATPRSPVAWTIVDGRVVVREGQLLAADFLELAHEAGRAREAIARRQVVRPPA